MLVPTLVPVPFPQGKATWTDLFIGSSSLFAFATLSDGTSWSWGDGSQGTLAIDDITEIFTPEQMLTTQSWKVIRGGESQVLGLAENTQAFAWGTGNEGQLGVGLALNSTVGPVRIIRPDQGEVWSELSANTEQSCGIFFNDAYCWGSSASGLLGSPGGDTSVPRLVDGEGRWGVTPFSPPPATPPPRSPTPRPNATKPPPPPPMKTSSGASVGVIVGATLGGVAVASLFLIGLVVWRRKRHQKRKDVGNSSMDNSSSNSNGSNAKSEAVLLWAAHSQEIESPRTALTRLIPPSLAPLEFDWSDVKVLKPLGAGSFGTVYLANINHTIMAVKVLVDADAVVAAAAASRVAKIGKPGDDTRSTDTLDKVKNSISSTTTRYEAAAASIPRARIEKMLQEASLMATLQHPNVVHLLGFCISPPCLAVEYCPRGSLYEVLAQANTDNERAKRLTWTRRLRMAKDVAAGLLHLHSRSPPILHRDVKSLNILVTTDLTLKVADMGLSKLAEEVQGGSKVSTGGGANPRWLAPEVLNGKKPSMESDLFSFGVVLWELLTWKVPWSEENVWAVSCIT